ncbi:MAG TPA: AAA family ATPase [Oligoflexia bacterium]|nr:AAA family ATPase [Oligoflexia bacterium]HMP49473.1 AAA family ATPase [Oligoflexia bacterium]
MADNYSLRESVNRVFDSSFVYYDRVVRVLTNGFQECHSGKNDGQNVILYGDGGYGKSQMSLKFARVALNGDEKAIFIKSVGASTREDEMWGGLDLLSLREGDSIRYLLKNSFLNYKIVIFEELFDLPDRILLDLKDTLSAREFRRGDISYPSSNRMIIACTNTPPGEVAKRGSDAKALVDRFPLQLKVEWPRHDSRDYIAMLRKQVPEHQSLAPLLAEICTGVVGKGTKPVPPRLAIAALHAIANEPKACGRVAVVPDDLQILLDLAPFCNIQKEASDRITQALSRFGDTLRLNRIKIESEELLRQHASVKPGDLETFVGIEAELGKLQAELQTLIIPGEKAEGFALKQEVARSITTALREKRRDKR